MRQILLHGHIFKNAGSTLDWSLRRSFGPGFCAHRDDTAMRDAPAAVLLDALKDARLLALSSHNLPSPPPPVPQVRFHTLFLLRDPIARVRSVYTFERHQRADTPGARAARDMDFPAYVAWRLQDAVRPVIRNFQTRFLAGGSVRHSGEALSPGAVAAARQRLADGALVGLVERYDESMVVLEAALRPLFPCLDLAYVPQNVGETPAGGGTAIRDELGPLWDEVLAHNTHDIELYSRAAVLLEQRIAAIPDFDGQLARFRRRTAALRLGC